MIMYAIYVYEIVKKNCEQANTNMIYYDDILNLVGISGIEALLENKLIRLHSVYDGYELYVLCKNNDKEEEKKHGGL